MRSVSHLRRFLGVIALPRSQVTNQVHARNQHVLPIRAQPAQVVAVEPSLLDESKTNDSAWGYALVSACGLGQSTQMRNAQTKQLM